MFSTEQIFVTTPFATASLPQMTIVGFPPANCGLTMQALPTELNAFTKRTPTNSRCNRSNSESSCVVKNFNTPWSGGASAMGLVASITILPVGAATPAAFTASTAPVPLTASTASSANFAASAKLTARPWDFYLPNQSTWRGRACPCFKNPAPKVFATSPEPMIPIFMRRYFTTTRVRTQHPNAFAFITCCRRHHANGPHP
jgi:hypothetical protein